MSLAGAIKNMFNDVQRSYGSEVRLCHNLCKLYKKSSYEEFTATFLECVFFAMSQSLKNGYAQHVLSFAASFSVYVAKEAKRNNEELYSSQETNIFLSKILTEVLQKQSCRNHNIRYHVCCFTAFVLEMIGEDSILDENLCDYVHRTLIERLWDTKPIIRIKAIDTLWRLQDPTKQRCPVISAFLISCRDPNSEVRKLITEKIAPCKWTIPAIVDNLSDMCEKIRTATFKKFSMIPPTWLRIIQRQEVLRKGFDEEGKSAKKAFIEILFPKWISHYDKNFLVFLTAVKLDADLQDVETTARLCYDIMKEIFKTHTIQAIMEYLPIDKRKLIPNECLSSELALYWNMIHKHILHNDLDELLELVVPELTPFCDYIERNLDIFYDDRVETREWKKLENEFIIKTLFEMARNFDFSDEVGRNRLHELVTHSIVKLPLKLPVIIILVDIIAKLNSCTNSFIIEISELMTSITDSKNVPTLEYRSRCHETMLKYKEKINSLSEELDRLIKGNDMKGAFKIEEEMKIIQILQTKLQNKTYKCDFRRELYLDEKCFDILLGLLKHKLINKKNQYLAQIEEKYIVCEDEARKSPLYKKLFECSMLFSIIDEKCALEYAQLVVLPIQFYSQTTSDEEDIVLLSIQGVTDLFRIYGVDIFREVPKKYNCFKDAAIDEFIQHLISKIVDMLDDERAKIVEHATKAISKIIYYGISITGAILARILIKWYNPITERRNPLSQQLFGVAVQNYCTKFKESEKVVIQTIRPLFKSFIKSPIPNLNIDNLIKFLAAITQLRQSDTVNLHNDISFHLCTSILETSCDLEIQFYIKLLIMLEIPKKQNILDELKAKIEEVIEVLTATNLKTKLVKYLEKMKTAEIANETDTIETDTNDNNNKSVFSQQSDSIPTETDTPDDYTIHDSDDSFTMALSLKRGLSVRSDEEYDEALIEAIDSASQKLHKKMKPVQIQTPDVLEEDAVSQGNKRLNPSEIESSSTKKPRLE